MAQYPNVTYPANRTITYSLGTGMHDLTGILNGAGFTSSSVTAHAGGGRPATPLVAAINLIAVCATAGDSCVLPPALGGQLMWISNGGAASSQILGAAGTTDTINGISGNTGVALAAGKSDVFMAPLPGAWFTVASA
jgi:hypothetical protein